MERMICQCCGEALHKRGDFYECRYCGATYRDDQAEKAAELLKGLLDDFKIEQLSNARRRLYETTHERYPSSQAVTQAAGNVLSISPDDFMARVYLHSHDSDPHELIALLSRGSVSEWEAKEAVAWLTRSLDMRALAAVKDFADRHLRGAEKTEALNRIEDEAFKLDSGVYDLSLRRDVFLCYSAEDMPRVIEVMEMLEENALSCFAAFRNLRHGKGAQENYQDAIFRAMKNCRVFVFLSSNSSRDPHRKGVAEELDHLVGDLKDKPRVEFLLEDYPERMPILAKRRMAEAFPHLEYCRDAEDLVVRVSKLLDAEENAERERARKIAEEASERAKKELQAEFEAREAARKEELEERLRLEKEKLEVERRRIEAERGSSALPPAGGAMDAESMLAMMEKAEELKRKRAEEAADKKKAEEAVDAIKAIGRVEPTPECRERIAAARARYSGLTERQRAHVHNADALLAAEREYVEAEAKERVATAKRAIEAIGVVEYTSKCKSRIDEAQRLYDALPENGKALVSNHATLVSAHAEYEKLKAEPVVDAIKAIGKVEFTPECRERIVAARTRYSGLTEGQRAHVHNADVLLAAEREYGEAEAKGRAATVERAIKAIGGMEYTPKCKSRIDEAQRLYDALPENAKALVSSHATLASARAEYEKLEAEAEERKRLEKEEDEAAERIAAIIDIEILPDGNASVAKCRDKQITGIAIPKRYRGRTVTSIGVFAFRDCWSLTSITIPESVTSIGEYAFFGCHSLTSITIPESVTSIGEYAFFGCSRLTSITIPESVTSIGYQAFFACYRLAEVINLSSLDISKGSTEYGWVGCYALGVISSASESKLHMGQDGFATYADGSSITLVGYFGDEASVTIPASVTSIGNAAFYFCTSLTSVTIPDSVTSIGGEAFDGCSCVIHFAHKKPLFGYPKGFSKDCLKGFEGKAFWGGK